VTRTRPVRLKRPLPPNAGPFGTDQTDPGDTDRLFRLYAIIDDEIGWPNQEAEDGGDYEGRLREVAAELRRLRAQRAVVQKRLEDVRTRIDTLLETPPDDFNHAARDAAEKERAR